ncbi:MAG: hypothetical protein ACRYFL_14980 [Janthinobacterium lividum]
MLIIKNLTVVIQNSNWLLENCRIPFTNVLTEANAEIANITQINTKMRLVFNDFMAFNFNQT